MKIQVLHDMAPYRLDISYFWELTRLYNLLLQRNYIPNDIVMKALNLALYDFR